MFNSRGEKGGKKKKERSLWTLQTLSFPLFFTTIMQSALAVAAAAAAHLRVRIRPLSLSSSSRDTNTHMCVHFLPRHWIHTDPFCCRLSRPFFTVNIRKRSSSCPAPAAAAASSRPVRLHAHTVGDEQECYLSIESPWRKLPTAAERSVTV